MTKASKTDQIVSMIRERIQSSFYFVGQRLPSERELADEFKVSRPTIRVVLMRLQADNLITIVPRGGIFVRSYAEKVTLGPTDPLIHDGPELQKSGSFIRSMEAKGKQAHVRFLEPSTIMPVGDLSAIAKMNPDTEVLRRYRVHFVDRSPYRILDSYYLAEYLSELLGCDDNYIPLFKWLRENKGVRASRAFEKISCRMPTDKEAEILNIARNQPVAEIDRWVWGEKEDNGEEILFEYTKIIANASLHDFTSAYNIHEEASK